MSSATDTEPISSVNDALTKRAIRKVMSEACDGPDRERDRAGAAANPGSSGVLRELRPTSPRSAQPAGAVLHRE